MQYTYKNININVSNLNPNFIQSTGETHLTIPSKLIAELLESSCTFTEFFLKYDQEELAERLEDNIDEIINHFKSIDEDIETENPDVIISVYEYALDNPDRTFTFDVETENISWVIHDVLHSVHDAGGCTIYVESEVEKARIIESLEITKELFPYEMPDYSFLENLENEYYQRFQSHIDLECFKEYEVFY